MAYAITSQFRASQKTAPYVGALVGCLAVACVALGVIGIIKGKFYLINHQPVNMQRSCAIALIAVGSSDLALDLFSLLEACVKKRQTHWKEAPDGKVRPTVGFVSLDGQQGFDYTKEK